MLRLETPFSQAYQHDPLSTTATNSSTQCFCLDQQPDDGWEGREICLPAWVVQSVSRMVHGPNPGRGNGFFFFGSSKRPNHVWGVSGFLFSGYRGCFLAEKWPGRDVNYWLTSGTEVMNEFSYISTPMSWRRKTFPSTFIITFKCARTEVSYVNFT
jgi:hypothetical protein